MTLLSRFKRWRYERAMRRAIRKCCQNTYGGTTDESFALEVIKDFELVNGVTFNPLDSYHVERIEGMAYYFHAISKMRALIDDLRRAA